MAQKGIELELERGERSVEELAASWKESPFGMAQETNLVT